MKRKGYLFEQVVGFESLLQATRRAARAGGSGLTVEAARFVADLEASCLSLQRELLSGSYLPGAYRTFMIHDQEGTLLLKTDKLS